MNQFIETLAQVGSSQNLPTIKTKIQIVFTMFLKFVFEYDNGKIQDSIYLNINCLHGSQLELKKTTLHI